MSFSSDVKAELCRGDVGTKSLALAEMYGVLLHCNTFKPGGIKIVTGSPDFSRRLPALSHRAFGVRFGDSAGVSGQGRRVISESDPEKLHRIYTAFGYEPGKALSHHINLGIIEDDEHRSAFVRGAFLAGGSVNDPLKRYHLEFITDHYTVSREMYSLFLEMGFTPRTTDRSGHYITYFKSSDVIADLLTAMGAPVAGMGIISARIEKDMTNNINRKVNCDTANVTKMVEAAAEQIAAIERLEKAGVLAGLSETLRQTARLRVDNPEMSLSELAEAADPPVTKSGLSHRLRKLTELARTV